MAVKSIDKAQFEALLHGDRPVVVDFWAPWCVYCRRIAPAVQMLAEQYAEEFVTVKINIDDEPSIAQKYGVEVIPTLMVFRGETPVGYAVNPGSKAAIEKFIKESLAK